MSALFSATYPHRTAALIMVGSYARRLRDQDYPYFGDREEALKVIDSYAEEWGGPVFIEHRLPSAANDPVVRKWWSRFLRMGATASAAAALQRMNLDIDIRHILPSIRIPTLILHATGDRVVPAQAGRYMAERIPHARFVEVDSTDHLPFYDKPDEFIRTIQEFLHGASGSSYLPETSVRTLMFTDIVGSTRLAVEKGDRRFSDLLEAHHATVRRELSLHRGEEIETTGDGFLASFDGPARAIRCGLAITESVAGIGVTTRVGLHTGECEVRQSRLRGIALNIASRVCDLAPPGGVLVSQTVRDLVAGAGFRFDDQGAHVLKGLPDQWRLFQVEA
jgi:class 3 adenylate cyclase